MSEPEIAERRVSLEEALSTRSPIQATVIRLDGGTEVETVTLLRYAGNYDQRPAFAIKNAKGKFLVRGAAQLGLDPTSPFALIA